MTAGGVAVINGIALVKEVAVLAEMLGLSTREEFRLGRRIWGAERRIDLLLTEPASRKRLGVECKFQNSSGSAEEKIMATVNDIATWPIQGLIVLGGTGFSPAMSQHLIGSGRAVAFADLDVWLRLYFRLELP